MPAIAFDVDDTLYDLAEPYWRACVEFFGEGLDLPLDELFRKSRIHSDEAYELVAAGMEPVEFMHVYRVQATFAEFGIEVTRSDALAFQRTYERCQGSISMSQQVRGILASCVDAGRSVGVITNGESRHQWRKVEALGIPGIIPREHIIVSGDIGFAKPSIEAFRAAERVLGCPPQDSWFVGDTYESDIVGALDSGWHCIWYNHRGRELRPGERRPDVIVTSEGEMAAAVMEAI